MNTDTNNRTFEMPREVPCPRWVLRRILANLRRTAYDRVCPGRARRAHELLQELETKQAAVHRNELSEPVMASGPPVLAASESRGPSLQAGRWQCLKSAAQRGLKTAANRVGILRQRGRTRQ